jgi:hypothetical protein
MMMRSEWCLFDSKFIEETIRKTVGGRLLQSTGWMRGGLHVHDQSDNVYRKLVGIASAVCLLLVLLDEFDRSKVVPRLARDARCDFRCSIETDNILANSTRSN